METNGQRGQTRERLLADLKMVIRDAENLLRGTRQQAGEGYQSARARLESTFGNARSGLSSLEESMATTARDALDTADEYVQSHPWQSVGIGALAGLVLGIWVSRR